jgi:hypothetical protein
VGYVNTVSQKTYPHPSPSPHNIQRLTQRIQPTLFLALREHIVAADLHKQHHAVQAYLRRYRSLDIPTITACLVRSVATAGGLGPIAPHRHFVSPGLAVEAMELERVGILLFVNQITRRHSVNQQRVSRSASGVGLQRFVCGDHIPVLQAVVIRPVRRF